MDMTEKNPQGLPPKILWKTQEKIAMIKNAKQIDKKIIQAFAYTRNSLLILSARFFKNFPLLPAKRLLL